MEAFHRCRSCVEEPWGAKEPSREGQLVVGVRPEVHQASQKVDPWGAACLRVSKGDRGSCQPSDREGRRREVPLDVVVL